MNRERKQEEYLSLSSNSLEEDVVTKKNGYNKLLLLGTIRWVISQPPCSVEQCFRESASLLRQNSRTSAPLDPEVDDLKNYCAQQAPCIEDTPRREAYDFVFQHIMAMKPDSEELHATLAAWAVNRRQRARRLRQETFCISLASELETAAGVCEELIQQFFEEPTFRSLENGFFRIV